MKSPVLSICIATYNRASYIDATLDSITVQLKDDIEIIVVDGASTDNTAEIMYKYTSCDKRINYYRLPEKGGVDRDYDIAVGYAEGKYCWFFTDDDIMKPGAIDAVLISVQENHDLVIVNADVMNSDLSVMIRKNKLCLYDDIVFSRKDNRNFFVRTADYLTFIGAVIIKKEIWESREKKCYYGTEFIHVGVIFQKILNGTVKVISNPYIAIRYGNAHWTERSFDIWMYKWPSIIWSFNDYSDKDKELVVKRNPWCSYRILSFHRSQGSYNCKVFKNDIMIKKTNIFWKIGALIISILPEKLFIFFRKTLKWYSSITHRHIELREQNG